MRSGAERRVCLQSDLLETGAPQPYLVNQRAFWEIVDLECGFLRVKVSMTRLVERSLSPGHPA